MAFSAILKKIRKIKCLAHPALLLFISGIAHAQPISVSDDTGQKLQFSQPVQRIIALSPAITENLFAIGLGERIGTIEPGKQADLIVLDRDVFKVSDSELFDTQVLETFFAGKSVYRAEATPAVAQAL